MEGLRNSGGAGLVEAEVSAVSAGGLDPLLFGLVEGGGGDVHSVGVPAAGECDVQAGGVGLVAQDGVGVVGGFALDAVDGGGVGKLAAVHANAVLPHHRLSTLSN